jgi:hypothetical protein
LKLRLRSGQRAAVFRLRGRYPGRSRLGFRGSPLQERFVIMWFVLTRCRKSRNCVLLTAHGLARDRNVQCQKESSLDSKIYLVVYWRIPVISRFSQRCRRSFLERSVRIEPARENDLSCTTCEARPPHARASHAPLPRSVCSADTTSKPGSPPAGTSGTMLGSFGAGADFLPALGALFRVEDFLAQPDGLRCDLNELVIGNEFDGLFKRHVARRYQSDGLVCRR